MAVRPNKLLFGPCLFGTVPSIPTALKSIQNRLYIGRMNDEFSRKSEIPFPRIFFGIFPPETHFFWNLLEFHISAAFKKFSVTNGLLGNILITKFDQY